MVVEHEKMTHELKQSILGLKIDDIKIPQIKKIHKLSMHRRIN